MTGGGVEMKRKHTRTMTAVALQDGTIQVTTTKFYSSKDLDDMAISGVIELHLKSLWIRQKLASAARKRKVVKK
jgi:hypothetical protein